MQKDQTEIQAAADRVIELEAELEAAGNAATDAESLARARAVLTEWIDGMVGIVASPALGRVTVIHKDGRFSSIASPDLAFLISGPASHDAAEAEQPAGA